MLVLEKRDEVSMAMGICAFFYTMKFFGVVVFQGYLGSIRGRGWGQSAMGICAFFYI